MRADDFNETLSSRHNNTVWQSRRQTQGVISSREGRLSFLENRNFIHYSDNSWILTVGIKGAPRDTNNRKQKFYQSPRNPALDKCDHSDFVKWSAAMHAVKKINIYGQEISMLLKRHGCGKSCSKHSLGIVKVFTPHKLFLHFCQKQSSTYSMNGGGMIVWVTFHFPAMTGRLVRAILEENFFEAAKESRPDRGSLSSRSKTQNSQSYNRNYNHNFYLFFGDLYELDQLLAVHKNEEA